MTARDRFKWALKCESCGRSGEASISENDGRSFMNRPDRTIDVISDGFIVINPGTNHGQETIIRCECGVPVRLDL
jgi:hypothetical protein